MSKELGQIGKNSILVIARKILEILIGLATASIVARVLGPEGQGIYSLAILLPTLLATFLNLGIAPATVYYVSKERSDLNSIVVTNVFFGLILGILGMAVGALVIFFWGSSLFPGVLTVFLWVALAVLPLQLIASFLNSVFHGLKDFKSYSIIGIFRRISFLLLLGVLFWKSDELVVILLFLSSEFLQVCLAFFLLKKHGFRLLRISLLRTGYVKQALWYGFRSHLSNILAFLNYRLDMFILGALSNPVSVGLYAIAVKIAEQIWILSKAFSEVLLPYVSGMKNETERNRVTGTISRNILWISVIISIVLFTLSPWIIRLLFGENYIESAKLLRILIPGIAVGAMSRVLSNHIAGIGKPEVNMYFALCTVSSNVVLNIILIPNYGAGGAAIATTVTYILNTVLKCIYFRFRLKVPFDIILGIKKEDLRLYSIMFKNILAFQKFKRT